MKTPLTRALVLLSLLCLALASVATSGNAPSAAQQIGTPTHLQVDFLPTPLGIDDLRPSFSWQLNDSRDGARQSAYEIQVSLSPQSLKGNKPDQWDSGRVQSDQTIGVLYGGSALKSSTRYFWRVKAWDKNGKPYRESEITWFETGLMDSKNWTARWISYEENELQRVMQADAKWIGNPVDPQFKPTADVHHNFRFNFDVPGKLKSAVLYFTGRDSAAAWINGIQVVSAQPLPPWKQPPWKTYTRKDITSELKQGGNLLSIEVVEYAAKGGSLGSSTPMSATVYVETQDGTNSVFTTGDSGWKSSLNANGNWMIVGYDDSSWEQSVLFKSAGNEELGNPWPTGSAKAFRKGFVVSRPIVSARLYATALGAYRFFLNGERVGDQVLTPGWMDYRQRVPYQVYDVTGLMKAGANAIGAWLAPGWYTTPLEWFRQGYNYGAIPPALKAELRIEHTDGSIEWIATDQTWVANTSPITFAEIYDGESYDARKFQAGWNNSGFNDSDWHVVTMAQPHEPEIVWQSYQPIREQQVLTAKKITQPAAGVYVFDFGQNMSAVPRLRVEGSAGTKLTLRFAEELNPDGSLYVENLRTAKATDHFTLSGQGIEDFQPAFTFHGFRYAEISGLTQPPNKDTLKAVVIFTDAPFTAKLKTGNAMINQLWSNILWGQRSNFVGVPTDCPQRDERLGWSADAQVFWRAATFNMDLAAFSRKFAQDLRGTQVGTPMYGIYAPGTASPNPGYGLGWSDAGVIIPWTSWIQSGDITVVKQNWEAMEKYLDAIESKNPDYLWKEDYGIPFADWLAPGSPTPPDLIATAFWANNASMMQQMAHAIGNQAAEEKYRSLFGKIKEAFKRAYTRPDGFVGGELGFVVLPSGVTRPDTKGPIDTQTSYVLALHMNLLPDQIRPLAAKRLADKIAENGGKLATGFLGTPYLLSALTENGYSDVAYNLLLNTDYPSWGYLVEHGATTMWERWNGDQMRGDPSMNSYNHYAYGAVAEWLYRYAAGVDTVADGAGFKTIFLHPNFDRRLSPLTFSYKSANGTIKSEWRYLDSSIEWHVVIPANTKGLMPAKLAQSLTVNGQGLLSTRIVKVLTGDGGDRMFAIPAGTYIFRTTVK